jgi:hypothetical protein
MGHADITEKDRRRAQHCISSHARSKQRGLAYWLVRNVENRICPFCRAYEKVYGRKAHEPIPEESGD